LENPKNNDSTSRNVVGGFRITGAVKAQRPTSTLTAKKGVHAVQIGDPVTNVLEKAMDVSWFRQQLIADNIANVDTPQYKRQDIDFQKTLENSLNQDASGSGDLDPVFIDSDQYSEANNGNNVDIENEMTQQAINLLQYDSLARLESDQLSMIKTAITGGGS
jgi:flagellar basal-body rod protein FlgB